MKMRGLVDPGTARQQIRDGVQELYEISVSRQPEPGEHASSRWTEIKFRVLEKISKLNSRGEMLLKFTETFSKAMKSATIDYYPLSLLRINTKAHPFAYSLGRKFIGHAWINKTGEYPVLGIRTLLQACGLSDANGSIDPSSLHNFKKRILLRIENALNECHNIFTWSYQRHACQIDVSTAHALTANEYLGLTVKVHFLRPQSALSIGSPVEPDGVTC